MIDQLLKIAKDKSHIDLKGRSVIEVSEINQLLTLARLSGIQAGLEMDCKLNPTPQAKRALNAITRAINQMMGFNDQEVLEIRRVENYKSLEKINEYRPQEKVEKIKQYEDVVFKIEGESDKVTISTPKKIRSGSDNLWSNVKSYVNTFPNHSVITNKELYSFFKGVTAKKLNQYKFFISSQGFIKTERDRSFRKIKDIPTELLAKTKAKN